VHWTVNSTAVNYHGNIIQMVSLRHSAKLMSTAVCHHSISTKHVELMIWTTCTPNTTPL